MKLWLLISLLCFLFLSVASQLTVDGDELVLSVNSDIHSRRVRDLSAFEEDPLRRS